jgi:hypothetical protein
VPLPSEKILAIVFLHQGSDIAEISSEDLSWKKEKFGELENPSLEY